MVLSSEMIASKDSKRAGGHLFAARELLHVAEAFGGRHGGELDAVQEGLVRALQAQVRRAAHRVHAAPQKT